MRPAPLTTARSRLALRSWRSTRAAVLLLLGVGVIASSPLLSSAATAADTDLTAGTLSARKAVGLPPIAEDAAATAAANAVLTGGDAQGAFSSHGGTGQLLTDTVNGGLALSNDKFKIVVFDPRLTAISVEGEGNKVAVAAAINPSLPFPAPVLAGKVVDPGVSGSLAILFPPGSGTIPKVTLQVRRGKHRFSVAEVATGIAGADGAILVALKGEDRLTGPQIGYGITGTVKAGKYSFTAKTIPIPKTLTSRPFVAGPGFKGSNKAAFLRYVREMPPEGRKIVGIIEGAVTVSVLGNTVPLCGFQTSCAGVDPGSGYFLVVNRAQLNSALGHFIVTHEAGHLVDALGLDDFSHKVLKSAFSRSGSWRKCFPLNGGGCTPFAEVLADQFAFFSTDAHGIQSGYNDPRLASRSALTRLLRAQWAFRPPQDVNPLAGFGPLARTFDNARRSQL